MIQGKICFVQTNFRHAFDVTFATKNKFNSNIYNLWYLGAPACFRRFQKNILGGAILVYNRYSEESVCNLTKRRTLPPFFSGEIFKNGWHSLSGKFPRKHSWWNVCEPKEGPKEGFYHQEIFKNRWLLTSSYATRNADCIPQIKIKHNFFKNTFFPSPIIEWKKLDPAIQNAESLDIFKSNILKIFRPTPKSFFSCYNHKGIG